MAKETKNNKEALEQKLKSLEAKQARIDPRDPHAGRTKIRVANFIKETKAAIAKAPAAPVKPEEAAIAKAPAAPVKPEEAARSKGARENTGGGK